MSKGKINYGLSKSNNNNEITYNSRAENIMPISWGIKGNATRIGREVSTFPVITSEQRQRRKIKRTRRLSRKELERMDAISSIPRGRGKLILDLDDVSEDIPIIPVELLSGDIQTPIVSEDIDSAKTNKILLGDKSLSMERRRDIKIINDAPTRKNRKVHPFSFFNTETVELKPPNPNRRRQRTRKFPKEERIANDIEFESSERNPKLVKDKTGIGFNSLITYIDRNIKNERGSVRRLRQIKDNLEKTLDLLDNGDISRREASKIFNTQADKVNSAVKDEFN